VNNQFERTASSAADSGKKLNFKAQFTWVNEHLKFHFLPEDAALMGIP